MNKKLMTSIKIATAVLVSAVVICFATPHIAGTDSKSAHGVDLPVQAAVITTLPETTTTVTTGTTTTTSLTSTSTTSTITSTSTTTSETTTTTVVTEEPAAPVETPAEPTEAATQPAEPQREYVVFKPSTHYIHKSTCHWVDNTCYEITDTKEIECRKCSECKPNLDVINEYVQPVSNVTTSGVSEYDYTLLCKIVASEYGGMADTYERAKIVASVMNMVNDSRWPGTVEGVLDQTCAPWGFNKYAEYYCGGSIHYSAMSDAVDYYFNNPDTFAGWTCNQWWGDGKYNHFRTI